MLYLLLTKFITPGGDTQRWDLYPTKEEAERQRDRHQKETEKAGWTAGWMCPSLVDYVILKVDVVSFMGGPDGKSHD